MSAKAGRFTGDDRLRFAFAGLLGFLSYALCGSASGQDIAPFKILKLEGHHVRWQSKPGGGPRVITYRMVRETVEFPRARNCRKITKLDGLLAASGLSAAVVEGEVAAAFAMWEAAANILFREAREDGPADILIGAQVDPEGWAYADVFYDATPKALIKPISKSLVCLNPLRPWKVGFDGDLKTYDIRYTVAHEIGHAIGLDHPQGGGQIMGYRYEERFRSLQPGDVRGAVALYGEPRRHAAETEVNEPAALPAGPSAARPFAKRWGTRGFTARSR